MLTGRPAAVCFFVKGQKDPCCIFRCTKTGIVLLHHVDDIRAAGPSEERISSNKKLPRHCEVQAGELEKEGTAVEYLGRTKVRSEDAILTIPDKSIGKP